MLNGAEGGCCFFFSSPAGTRLCFNCDFFSETGNSLHLYCKFERRYFFFLSCAELRFDTSTSIAGRLNGV